MTAKPRISVVTATFNRAATLAQCLRSVQSQTYPHVEHIIQDAGSTDWSLEVIKAMMTENTKLISHTDDGIYDGINKGIALATGDVVGLLHSDDFYASDTVLEKVAELMEDPAVDGVYGDLDYVDAEDTSKIIRKWRSGDYTANRLRQGWMPPHPTVYLRRSVFDSWGLYDTSYSVGADYDAMLRYLSKGKVTLAYLPEVMVKMRRGGKSNGSIVNILRKSSEDYRSIRRNGVGGFGTLARKNLSKVSQFF